MGAAVDLVDSHCHFDFPQFDADRELIWKKCNEIGVSKLIIPGVSVSQWKQIEALSESCSGIFFSVGVHPWWIEKETQLKTLKSILRRAASAEKCVAIGECGLDALIATPINIQQQVLAEHIEIANELLLPMIIHCRKAHNELLQRLKQNPIIKGGVIHGFSGSLDLANQYIDMGFYIGVGGTITYDRAKKTRETVSKISLQSILLETDSPDMPLFGKQGQRNSPEYIVDILHALSETRSESIEPLAAQIRLNTQRLFAI